MTIRILWSPTDRLKDFHLTESTFRFLFHSCTGSTQNVQAGISVSGSLLHCRYPLQSKMDWFLHSPSWNPTNIIVQWIWSFTFDKESDREEQLLFLDISMPRHSLTYNKPQTKQIQFWISTMGIFFIIIMMMIFNCGSLVHWGFFIFNCGTVLLLSESQGFQLTRIKLSRCPSFLTDCFCEGGGKGGSGDGDMSLSLVHVVTPTAAVTDQTWGGPTSPPGISKVAECSHSSRSRGQSCR